MASSECRQARDRANRTAIAPQRDAKESLRRRRQSSRRKSRVGPEILAIEFQGLIELGFDVELTGFEIAEVDLILEDSDDSKRRTNTPDDLVPEPLPGPP